MTIALPAIEKGAWVADGEASFNLYLKLREVMGHDSDIESDHENQFYQVFEHCHDDWGEVIRKKAKEQVCSAWPICSQTRLGCISSISV